MKKSINRLLALALALAVIMGLSACGKKPNQGLKANGSAASGASESVSLWDTATYTKDTELGEGSTPFILEVAAEDKTVTFTVSTNKKTLGDALLELKLIDGEQQSAGFYVKKVNGITADYDVDQTYWAFYVNGEYATKGVDTTEIDPSATYRLERTK